MHYIGAEKRKFKRVRCPCKIIIHDIPEHNILTHTENISVGGVRVIIDEQIKLGSLVDLEIDLKEAKVPCSGRIVWVINKSSPYKKGVIYHDTGIEFQTIIDKHKKLISSLIENICKC